MRYVLTDAALEARDLRIKLRLREEEIVRLQAECQQTMDDLVATARRLAVMESRLRDAGLSTDYRSAA